MNVRILASLAKLNFIYTMQIKREEFVISEDEVKAAIPLVDYVKRFTPALKKVGIRNRDVLIAIGLIASFPEIDKERLFVKIHENIDELRPYSKIAYLLDDFSRIYNSHLRNKVDLLSLWKAKGIKDPQ